MLQDTPQEIPQVRRQMLQSLLANRFALKMHKTTEQLPVFEIVVAKGGPKLTPYVASGQGVRGLTAVPPNEFKFVGVPIQFLAGYMSSYAGRMIIDRTGLKGLWDFTVYGVDWTPNPLPTVSGAESGASAQAESIFSAMKDQLGLELKAAKDPVTVFVVDQVEPPTPN